MAACRDLALVGSTHDALLKIACHGIRISGSPSASLARLDVALAAIRVVSRLPNALVSGQVFASAALRDPSPSGPCVLGAVAALADFGSDVCDWVDVAAALGLVEVDDRKLAFAAHILALLTVAHHIATLIHKRRKDGSKLPLVLTSPLSKPFFHKAVLEAVEIVVALINSSASAPVRIPRYVASVVSITVGLLSFVRKLS
jgi:hypothetical protein